MSFHFATLWYVAEWIVRIGALLVVPQRRTANATRAWLLLIFFLPIPGLLLYLLIGSPRFPAWRTERFASLVPYFRETVLASAENSPELGDKAAIAELADDLGRMPVVSGNSVELIDVYDAVINRLEQDIDGANSFVHLLVYIFADDHVGQRIAAALGRAVKRGVEARVMFDPVGSHSWRKGTLKMLRSQGVDVREALPWCILRDRSRGDMRDHRKLFVIDGHIGYAGSQNLVAKDFRPGVVNHELVARVTGPAVAEMEAIVRGDWCLETGVMPDHPIRVPDATGTAIVQLLPSGADYRLEGFESLLVWQIHQATERMVLVTPYFIPDVKWPYRPLYRRLHPLRRRLLLLRRPRHRPRQPGQHPLVSRHPEREEAQQRLRRVSPRCPRPPHLRPARRPLRCRVTLGQRRIYPWLLSIARDRAL
ncbi:phospholipase D-like domain-containing protein [Sphingobium sp. BYY-5]|uniref:phospholipase D-like domain-containing protein n=1 Tax=Sphingobium sp. BYY-5 TaxID=2926400 RepID=UPI001FA6EEE5|nr:phospholipase D-like domain-containing protein [Sphingobium sp. BYY-5]MCI4589114.1 phospholipase D-like domain-containing protein [Sphingobium sp. BYY-5]